MSDFEDKLSAILSNPGAMNQIASIAQSLNASPGDGAESDYTPVEPISDGGFDLGSMLGNLDPKLIQMGMRLLSEYNSGGDDNKAALFAALRPFVKEERYSKLDRAMQATKLSRVIRTALDSFKGGGDGV